MVLYVINNFEKENHEWVYNKLLNQKMIFGVNHSCYVTHTAKSK